MLKNFAAVVDSLDETSDGSLIFFVSLGFFVPEKLKNKAEKIEKKCNGEYSVEGFGCYVTCDGENFNIDTMVYVDEDSNDHKIGYKFNEEEKNAIRNACDKAIIAKIKKGKE